MQPPLWPPSRPLRRVFRRREHSSADVRESVDEELAFHLEMCERELLSQGLSAEEARARALDEFGDLNRTRDFCTKQSTMKKREVGTVNRFDELVQDTAYAIRTLRRNVTYSAVVIATLAFGIAANTLIFSLMNPYFFRALPYEDAGSLVQLGLVDREWDAHRYSFAMMEDVRSRSRAFGEMGAYIYGATNVTGAEGAERINITRSTDNMLELLGAQPLHGRIFVEGEGGPGGADVVLVNEGLWRRRYAADPGLIGSTIQLNDVPHTVIGIMPEEFSFPFNEVKLWLPLHDDITTEGREETHYMPVVRLNPGWTPERAEEELNTIHVDLAEAYPDIDGEFTGVSVKGLREAWNFAYKVLQIGFTVLLTAVVFVLMIACVNVASLTLARASVRAREVALRAALGAGRWRLVRQFLTESVILALVGGLMGVGAAYLVAELIGPLIPEGLFRVGDVKVDGTVLLFSLAVTLTTPLFFGLLPAMNASKANLTDALKEGARGGGPGSLKGRKALIAIEVALAIVLISGTGLMVRSFQAIQEVDLGFNADNLLVVEVSPPASSYPSSAELSEYFDRAAREIEALPGIRSVGASSWLPLNHETMGTSFARPGMEPADEEDWSRGIMGWVSGSYFESMEIPVIAGRSFTAGDGPDAAPVVIVSKLLADRHWPDESPVGHTILAGDPDDPVTATVIGVVGDLQHSSLDSEPLPYVYESMYQKGSRRRFLTIAAEGTPGSVAPQVRRVLMDMDGNLPLIVRPMSEFVLENTLQWSFGSAFLAALGLVALLLASLGIYGMISFSVAQRRREMGIRIAMGATGASLRRLVVGEGLRLTAIGLAVGFVLALVMGRVMSSALFGVSPFDPVTFGTVLVLFLIVAAIASLIPALRAERVDPLQALRAE